MHRRQRSQRKQVFTDNHEKRHLKVAAEIIGSENHTDTRTKNTHKKEAKTECERWSGRGAHYLCRDIPLLVFFFLPPRGCKQSKQDLWLEGRIPPPGSCSTMCQIAARAPAVTAVLLARGARDGGRERTQIFAEIKHTLSHIPPPPPQIR